jgi:uncharacterized membrane protein
MMSSAIVSAQPAASRSLGDELARHWFLTFGVIFGLWVWLPFAAPIFMHAGWDQAGRAIYFIYSFFCHQLPERSFFLFGRMPMYSLAEIQAAGQNTINPFVLRKFIGDPGMGWKIAWSDRMISFYTSIWMLAVLWHPFRSKVKPLPWRGLAVLILPIILDGGTHALSDLAGIGQGFRDSNAWLATLTNHALSGTFYAGDALGSFNSGMRMLTGIVAGAGLVWFTLPHVERPFVQG